VTEASVLLANDAPNRERRSAIERKTVAVNASVSMFGPGKPDPFDTSAHETRLPKSNGATIAPRVQKPEVPASREQKEKSPVTLDHLASSHPCGRRRNVVLDLFESVRIDR
jgi:hypothetical protein